MNKPPRPCSKCRKPVYRRGLCHACFKQADIRRGSPHQRGYNQRHREFRAKVLARDPICMACQDRVSTVADHHPLTLKQLVTLGRDPYEPAAGRGLCEPCHNASTASATFN